MKKAIMSTFISIIFLGLSFGENLNDDKHIYKKQKIDKKEPIKISSIKTSQNIVKFQENEVQVLNTGLSVDQIKSQVIYDINNSREKIDKAILPINSLPDIMGKIILENQSYERKSILKINNSPNGNTYRALYNISVGGGSWDSEISWSVSLNGSEVLSGIAGDYLDVEMADGDYVLTMIDSYGDGWNGGSWNISTSAGNIYTFLLESGSELSVDFSLPGEVDTTVYGCMLEDAPNYNPDAEVDDGSCEQFVGAEYSYWNSAYAGYYLGCDLYYIFQDTDGDGIVDAQGNGDCDNDLNGLVGTGLACAEFSCDGGDCEDCVGDCLGTDTPSSECWDGSLACAEEDCPASCENTECLLTMNDSYGDGWNGNIWESGDQSATLSDGDNGSISLCFDLAVQNEYSIGGGSYTSEVSWFLDCGDELTLSGFAPENGCFGDCSQSVPGCTDETAENYNPDATTNDGSCTWNGGCSSSSYVSCADGSECILASYVCDGSTEYGNASWGPDCDDGSDEGAQCCDSGDYVEEVCVQDCNGDIFGTAEEDCAGDCDGSAALDDNGDCCYSGNVDQCGVCDGDGTSCECSSYTLVVGGGSWDSEITWDLTGSDTSESGVVGTFDLCLSDGTYTFNGFDSYGDGWNGATATITNADGGLLYTFIVDGDQGSWEFDLPGEIDTTVYGCMLENAPNFNPDAESDDGSCEYYVGANFGYWNSYYEGWLLGCSLYYIYSDSDGDGIADAQGNGSCDDDPVGGYLGLACAEFDCDGGDCADCSGTCLGDEVASNECWDGSLVCSEDDCPDFCTDSVCELTMADSYGDGWNGASFTSGDQSVTLEDGTEGTVLLCFDLSIANNFTVGGGSWDSEISWLLDCADGNPLSGGAPYSGCIGTDCSEPLTCEQQWDACVESLVGTEYYEACSAEDCVGGPGGECDGNVVPNLSDECGTVAFNVGSGDCPDPCTGGGDDGGGPDLCFGLVIAMFDSYGDGWNGGVLTVGDQTFSLDDTTDGDGLSSGTACYQNEAGDGWDNNVVVTCDGSSYNSEISWAMYDYTGTVLLDGGAPFEGCLGDCGGASDGGGDDCLLGDNNNDETINVQDIILVVNYIMGTSTDDLPCGDMNDDGSINVQDIVSVVNIIMGISARVESATEATLVIRNNDLLLRSNGFVQGVQLTLTHDDDFSIKLEEEYISEILTSRNHTKLILVTDGLNTIDKIGDTNGSYTILSSIVSDNNANSILTNQITEITDFMLTEAFPNPFNPTTNLSLVLSEAGYVSVKIYNIVGQEVAILADGIYEANINGHQLTWDASNVSSGVYIVRAESLGQVSTQKLMLLK